MIIVKQTDILKTTMQKDLIAEQVVNAEKNTTKIDFKILDGLRGIAALYVVFNHSRGNLFMGGGKIRAN